MAPRKWATRTGGGNVHGPARHGETTEGDRVCVAQALHAAAQGQDASPYINHPIAVTHLLADTGGVTDLATLMAAVLHDTLEDTKTTAEELEAQFGRTVRELVEELTDDKKLGKAERKQLQIDHAPVSPHRRKRSSWLTRSPTWWT